MDVFYRGQATMALDAKLAYIRGFGSHRMVERIAREVEDGNAYDRLHGITRYSTPVAPLRSTRKGKYKGASGPPLAPFGARSRVVANFRTVIRRRGIFARNWQVRAGWIGVVSRKGVPFLPFHDMGSGRLPERPIFGISARTMGLIDEAVEEFRSGVGKAR